MYEKVVVIISGGVCQDVLGVDNFTLIDCDNLKEEGKTDKEIEKMIEEAGSQPVENLFLAAPKLLEAVKEILPDLHYGNRGNLFKSNLANLQEIVREIKEATGE